MKIKGNWCRSRTRSTTGYLASITSGSRGAMVATLSLEFYEAQKLKNVVQFTAAA